MQLRRTVTVPTRFEDEVHNSSPNRNGTKPAYPTLLKAQIVPFNPNNPPAAFPSLPLTSASTPAARDSDRPEEMVNIPDTLHSLRLEGLGINLAGSGAVEEDDPPAQWHTVEPITVQQDTEITEGPIVDDPIGAEVLTTSSNVCGLLNRPKLMSADTLQTNCVVTWDHLPLSLQSHIYKALSGSYPSKLAPILLGLTEHEAFQIEKAVSMRVLHPATVAEIWDYCSKASAEGSAPLQPPSVIDADVFDEYVGYMVFASNYELAFESEVRLAREFLSSRGIATEVLGTWMPDPSDVPFDGLFRHVPGTTGRPSLSNNHLAIDSGYSSLSEADQTLNAKSSDRHSQPKHDLIKKRTAGNRSTKPTTPASLVYSIKHRPTFEPLSTNFKSNLVVKITPHPRAIVDNVGGLQGTSGDPFFDAGDFNEKRTGVPHAGLHSTKAASPHSTLETSQKSQIETRDEGPMVVDQPRDCSASEGTLAAFLSKANEHVRNLEGDDASQQPASQLSEERTQIGDAPNPQRLVLRIQNKDGLAKILRTKPRHANWGQQALLANSGNTTALSLKRAANPSESSSLFSPSRSTDVSGFSTAPVVENVERSLHCGMFDITLFRPENRLPVKPQSRPGGSGPVAPEGTKRKPSQSDIRPDTSKVQRLLTVLTSATPSKAISLGYNGDNTKVKDETSNVESATAMTGTLEGTGPPEILESRSPVSPSWSPISENEDLQDFQARLRGSPMHRTRGEVPDPSDGLSSHPGFALAPSSACAAKLAALAESDRHLPSSGAGSYLSAEEIQDTPPNIVDDVVNQKTSGTDQHKPLTSGDVEMDQGNKASLSSTTSEQTSRTTRSGRTVQRRTANQKKRGGQRGPRGPYRKTRERLAKLAEEGSVKTT
ncbi:hypothetical protein Z517_08587 [Fonsecaea pedrosoi CBS 271.37]|uniref:Uncharacterized protein n=1 Tax=Fonsecaea pedrosoi CBS 271.37 TaxID=1442368 RepID=A0A0D2GDB6_9EURO|nr:uncharacterized protein Z517_08587 [Fonsecaea pedrosoi CBS 271.37]KIW78748.1 hypothetical protein Z517_08587 [Fonsecaea pedrosoi CBS 271.37]